MKTCLTGLLALGIFSLALHAGEPPKAPAPGLKKEVAGLIARVAFATARGRAESYASDGTGAVVSVYSVKHGLRGSPGYSLVVASDPDAGQIIVLSDRTVADPPHGIKCSGHVAAFREGVLIKGSEKMILEAYYGTDSPLFGFTGPLKSSTPIGNL